MKIAVFPGSFDPVTLGHLDIITRAAAIFKKVYVSVLANGGKNPLFSVEERMELLKEATHHLPNVEIESFSGLLTEYLKEKESAVVIRGIRSARDAEYELEMYELNKQLYDGVETLFLPTSPQWRAVSSSAVKEIASFGGKIDGMVPPGIVADIQKKYE